MTGGLSGTEVVERAENLFLDGELASTNFFGP
jgi:hypothetical protein